jgi:hypothetical protein
MILRILDLESTERTAILGQSDLSFEVYAKGEQTLEVNLLASSYVNVFCRCVAAERVPMECGNAVRVASGGILLKDCFLQGRFVGTAVGICEEQRV